MCLTDFLAGGCYVRLDLFRRDRRRNPRSDVGKKSLKLVAPTRIVRVARTQICIDHIAHERVNALPSGNCKGLEGTDLIVVEGDPFAAQPDLAEVAVRATMIGGHVVHDTAEGG